MLLQKLNIYILLILAKQNSKCPPSQFHKLIKIEKKSVQKCKKRKNAVQVGDLEVTSNENHRIIHLFKIMEILNKFKIFKYHRIG